MIQTGYIPRHTTNVNTNQTATNRISRCSVMVPLRSPPASYPISQYIVIDEELTVRRGIVLQSLIYTY